MKKQLLLFLIFGILASANLVSSLEATSSDVAFAFHVDGDIIDATGNYTASAGSGGMSYDTEEYKIGNASFNATTTLAKSFSIDQNFNFSTDGAFSISFWAKPDTSADEEFMIGRKATVLNVIGFPGGTYTFPHFNALGFTACVAYGNEFAGKSMRDGNWHFVVATASGSSGGDVKIYLDGKLVGDGACAFDAAVLNFGFLFGVQSDGSTTYDYQGLLDEITLWGINLSLSDIIELNNSVLGYPYIAIDTTPPIIDNSTWNVTSAINPDNQTIWQTDNALYSITTDSTPTVTFTTDDASRCAISTSNLNYTGMTTEDTNTNCSSTPDTTAQSCTLPSTKALSEGKQFIYVGCINSDGYEMALSTSGPLAIELLVNTPPTPPTSVEFISPAIAYTDSLLVCNASGSEDAENDTIYYHYQFRDSDNTTILQNYSTSNTTDCGNIAGCDKGDTIYCFVKAFDGQDYSEEGPRAEINILNSKPTQGAPALTSSEGTNYTDEDLICSNVSTSDADNDKVTNIFAWYKNGQPLTVLNLPFESNINDYSGYGNNGLNYGASFVDGKVGKALSFDGINDYIKVPYKDSLATDNEMTAEAWVRFDSITAGRFVTKSYYRDWLLGYHNNYFYFGGHILGDTWRYATYSMTPTANIWYHVVGTLKNNTLEIYVDDVKGTDYNAIADFEPEAYQIEIGNSIRWEEPFNGTIDEVKIYPHALTAEQISNNFNLNYNKIVSQETTKGETYVCNITPTDGFDDGESKASNSLTILNSPPTAPDLLTPPDIDTFGAFPTFSWSTSTDADGDTVTYHIVFDDDSNFASTEYSPPVGTSTSHDPVDGIALPNNIIDQYYWKIIGTDGIVNVSSGVRTFNYSQWNIEFNITNGEQGNPEIPNVNISYCNYTGFDQAGDTTNLYGPYGFPPGNWRCNFKADFHFDKTQTFVADADKIVHITMSYMAGISYEEHTWLEALYNCIILKDCDLWDLLTTINQTTGYIWQHLQPTDQSVLTTETISEVVNSTHNVSYNAIVNVPIKQGYGLGDYLPIRIGYWFIDKFNASKCFSQGNPPSGIELIEPYCQPLMIQTMGPMGGSVKFRVDLRPNLTIGTYNITRRIEIDPNNVWIPYGHEDIGQIEVTEDSLINPSTSVGDESYVNPDKETIIIKESSSGGGGGGGNNNPITQIYQNITYIINQPEGKEESAEKEEVKYSEEKLLTEEERKEKTIEENKRNSLASVTGAAVGIFSDIKSSSSLVGILGILCLILCVLVGYYYAKSKKK